MDFPDTTERRPGPGAPGVPAVLAVVVAKDPGDWFDETLASLRDQDYPRCAVEVVDAASVTPVEPRVAAVVPDATVRRLDADPGFAASANVVLERADRPAFVALCHDDVALAPDAIRLLVEEAVRSNAGIVGPKLVDWDRPNRLLAVGTAVDKTAAVVPLVEHGELDQEQHDAVRDVFAVTGGVMLVRFDLFAALGGFDQVMTLVGEDVDLCWRAHVAGARVVVVPSAAVRHRGALDRRREAPVSVRLERRHQVRTLLGGYGVLHTLRVVPQAMLAAVVEALVAVVTGRLAHARAIVGAWAWNAARLGSIAAKRRRLRAIRSVPDAEVRRFQSPGFAPITALLRGRGDAGGLAAWSRDLLDTLRSGPARSTVTVWALVLAVFAFGSRHLLTRGVPAIGELAPIEAGPRDLFAAWWQGWQPVGLGQEGPATPAFALLGTITTVLFGATGLAHTLLTVGAVMLGGLGMWRLAVAFGSRWTRLVALIAYLLAPVPYNALTAGSWSALLGYAALPWIMHRLTRAAALEPYGTTGVWRPAWAEVLAGALVLAAVASLLPAVALMVVIVVVGVVVGSVVAADLDGVGSFVASALGVLVAAVVLSAPWSVDVLLDGPQREVVFGARPEAGSSASTLSLLRFDTGNLGGQPLGWALLVAAALSLLLAREHRFAWAVRGWAIYVASVAAAMAGEHGWLGIGLPRPEVLLVPGALGLAMAVAMGMAAFEWDLRHYGFGWRQLVPVTAFVGLIAASLPVLAASLDGAWKMPPTGLARSLAFIDDEVPAGSGRVLWIGHDDVLTPGSWTFDDQLSFAITSTARPTVQELLPGSDRDAADLVARAVELATEGGTSRLGALLAPFGIRYVVVPERQAPPPHRRVEASVDPVLLASLDEQLDLARVELMPELGVYRNAAWQPVVTAGPAGTFSQGTLRDGAARAEVTEAIPAMELVDAPDGYAGAVRAGEELYVAVPRSDRWTLRVDGVRALRVQGLGWATAFEVPVDGAGELRHSTPTSTRALQLGQVALWVVAVAAVLASARVGEYDELGEVEGS